MTEIKQFVDFFEQGRENICAQIYKDQFDPTKYPEEYIKSTKQEINEFLNKLVVVAPIPEFTYRGHEMFRVMKILAQYKEGLFLLDIQKLEKLNIKVYMSDNEEYCVKVHDEEFHLFCCPPNIEEIVGCVVHHMGQAYTNKRAIQRFAEKITKLIEV